jgi:VIT1/CCC1 family predicted Fe2+/Mn2+ transporter
MNTPRLRRHLKHRRERSGLPLGAQKALAVLEGIEGGFAISAGLVAGLSFANISNRHIMLITAGISILVNGFNASAVKYMSEHYEDELDGHEKKHAFRSYFVPAALEFATYFVVCALTLVPLFIFPHHVEAVIWCTTLTLMVLYLAGVWKGYLMGKHPVKDGIELATLGLMIIAVGALSGYLLSR